MDFTRQSPRAQNMHSTFLARGEKTCIDCHKGIAHRLPFIPPGAAPTDTPGQVPARDPDPGQAAVPAAVPAAAPSDAKR
jgi:cytochrome c-type protein NapC